MQEYVNGFMIDQQTQHVLLIRKNRPAFQADKWNGIGGKIEPGETTWQAMVREFREETSVTTFENEWEPTIVLTGIDFVVHFFRTFVNGFPAYRSVTDETVNDWPIGSIYAEPGYGISTLPNLKWLMPLNLNYNVKFPLVVEWIHTDEAHA
jgi:8-oxo-dGTP diphosphatase